MKKKNAFTLIELLAVLIIISVILLLIGPQIMNKINDSKTTLYKTQIEEIKKAGRVYVSKTNIDFDSLTDKQITITLGELKKAGLVERDIKNPKNGKKLNDCITVTITKTGTNNYTYTVNDDISQNTNCKLDENFSLILIGNSHVKIKKDSNYRDDGILLKGNMGNFIDPSNVDIKIYKGGNLYKDNLKYSDFESSIDTSELLVIYEIAYIFENSEVRRIVEIAEDAQENELNCLEPSINNLNAEGLSNQINLSYSLTNATLAEVIYQESGSSTIKNATGCTPSGCEITELTSGATYLIVVKAINNCGTTTKEIKKVTTATTECNPPTISDITATPISSSKVNLDYHVTNSTNNDITVSYKLSNASTWTSVDGCSVNGCVINNLEAYKTYKFKVETTNPCGNDSKETGNIRTLRIATPTFSNALPKGWSKENKKFTINYDSDSSLNNYFYVNYNYPDDTSLIAQSDVYYCGNTASAPSTCESIATTSLTQGWYKTSGNTIEIEYGREYQYTFKAITMDNANNKSTAATANYSNIDKTSPVISSVTTSNIKDIRATFTINATDYLQDRPSVVGSGINNYKVIISPNRYIVESSTTLNYSFTYRYPSSTPNVITVDRLSPNTTYYYKIIVTDGVGLTATTEINSFTTTDIQYYTVNLIGCNGSTTTYSNIQSGTLFSPGTFSYPGTTETYHNQSCPPTTTTNYEFLGITTSTTFSNTANWYNDLNVSNSVIITDNTTVYAVCKKTTDTEQCEMASATLESCCGGSNFTYRMNEYGCIKQSGSYSGGAGSGWEAGGNIDNGTTCANAGGTLTGRIDSGSTGNGAGGTASFSISYSILGTTYVETKKIDYCIGITCKEASNIPNRTPNSSKCASLSESCGGNGFHSIPSYCFSSC